MKKSVRRFDRRSRLIWVVSLCGLSILLGSTKEVLAILCENGKWTAIPIFGRTNTKPAAVVFNDNLHLFVTRNNSDRVFTAVFTPGDTDWRHAGFVSLSQNIRAGGNGPATAVVNNQLYLFIIDPTGRVLLNTLPSGVSPSPSNFTGWSEVPGGPFIATHEPSAAALGDELNLFVRGTDGGIYFTTLVGGVWSGEWKPVPGGGITTHGPSATFTDVDTNLYVYVRGTDAGLYENVRDTVGNWRGWRRIGTQIITDSPAAVGVFAGVISPQEGIEIATRIVGGGIAWQAIFPTSGRNFPPTEVFGDITATAGPAAVANNATAAIFGVFVPGANDRIFCSSV